MFRQRLLTLMVLIPLVLLAIYYGNVWVFRVVALLLILAGGWEWLQLIPISRLLNQLIFIGTLLLSVWICMYWFQPWLILNLILWGLILIAVVAFPTSQKIWGYPLIVGAICLLLLPIFGCSLDALYQYSQGKDLLVYLLCLVWAADIGAYLAGKCWGRHKLIPQVSPGKTVEGVLGGIGLAMIVALVGYFYFSPTHPVIWFVVTICTVLISILGDLFISMLKRRRKLKDTGNIFPGHGGVLDRIDSLIAALPLFYFGLYFIHTGF